MGLILGIETSCDETAAAVYDSEKKVILSNEVFSQIKLHEKYGGVVPEIASRSHLEKIGFIVNRALSNININSIDSIDCVAVTNKPGLAGALLIGLGFAKGLAWANNKKLLGVDHMEAHVFSSFITGTNSNIRDSIRDDIEFPHISLVVSGGHTSIYLVKDFGVYDLIGHTLDDAAGEAFDKVSKLIGLGYPGGPKIESFACKAKFFDFFSYPRTKDLNKSLNFSFSGLKTAVLYDLVKRGAYDLNHGIIANNMTDELREQVASSLLVCMSDIFVAKLKLAIKKFPHVCGITFTGGVACNKFLREKLKNFCKDMGKDFVSPPAKFCGDNASMVAFVGGYKYNNSNFDTITLDIYD